MAVAPQLVRIDLTRDSLFDAFTIQTFQDRYLIPGETSPQHAFARASAAFADDVDHAQRLYDYVSQGWFMFATPLLSNGGTSRGLPISCFLSTAEDSREGIFDHWTETGWLSSVGGGVGGYWPLRSSGAKTSHGSSSTGVIPFIATVDRLILSVSQGGCYLPGTRIMTERGWVDFRELTPQDTVAQVNDDRSISFVIPREIVTEPFDGELYHYTSKTGLVDLVVTPNHGMIQERRVVRDGKKVWSGTLVKTPAEDARYHRDNAHHTTAPFLTGADAEVTAIERLRIAFQADGSIVKVIGEVGKYTGCQPVSFHLKKIRKIERLRGLLADTGLEYTETAQKGGSVNFYVKVPLELDFQKNLDWLTPWTYAPVKMSALLSEIECWDAKRRKNTAIYLTTVKSCADKVLELAALAGRRAHVSREDRPEPRQPLYSVYIQDGYGRLGGDSIETFKLPYKGDVYCVEVETGKVLVEYNGAPAVCGNTRRGSYAAYMDIDHPEVMEFITGRKATGDANRKFTNLHNALCITDKFMEAVRDDVSFDLIDPKTKAVTSTHSAQEMWHLILETRKQTGEPYMFFVDHANRALPEAQKKKGLRVNQSNLCVAPYTEILTSDGYKPIGALVGQEVEVWNGDGWSGTVVEQTGTAQELVRVWFEDGSYLDVTPYHKFYDEAGTEIRAAELRNGTTLERVGHPTVSGKIDYSTEVAYTAGYATFVGFEDADRLTVFSPDIPGDALTKRLMQPSVDASADPLVGGFTIRYETRSIPSGRSPQGWTTQARSAWFAGALDAVGVWVDVEGEGPYLSIASTDSTLINQMRLDALEAGLSPRVRITDTGSGFMLNASDIQVLISKNLILKHTSKTPGPFGSGVRVRLLPKVADVVPLPYKADTYCVTETLRSRATFNGILTGNCTEITLATGRDDEGKKRTAVCCLSSVNAEKFDEWSVHPSFVEDLMRMLDNCLTVFIEKAPEALAYAVYSASQERSVGLGLLGFHAYLQKNSVPFESHAARTINKRLFRHLRSRADAASLKLGAERGEAPDMAGTGERFAHKMAIAPNASSSILCGNTSPSIEPWRANAYLQKTLSGSFPVKNPYLIRELAKYGLDTPAIWKAIIGDEGSVLGLGQRVEELGKVPYYIFTDLDEDLTIEIDAEVWEHLQQVFKTFTELDMRWVVQHGRDRQCDIDQAQSVNLAFPHDAEAGYMSEVHYDAWDPDGEGDPLKSLYYYRSTTSKRAENTNDKVARADVKSFEEPSNTLSANPLDDIACPECEG